MNDIIFIVILWILIGLFSFWQRKMRSKAKEAKSQTTTTAPPVKKESELKRILREKFDIEIPEPPEPKQVEVSSQEEYPEPYVPVEEPHEEWDTEYDEEKPVDVYEEEIDRSAQKESLSEREIQIPPELVVSKVQKYLPRTKSDLKTAIIFKEIIDPPLSKRGKRRPYFLQ